MAEVILGVVVTTFGIKGEVKIHSNTDFAKKRYKVGNEVILYSPLTHKKEVLKVASYKTLKGMDIVSFEGYNTPETVAKFINYQVLIEKPEDKLAKDTFYYADLYGLNVYFNDELVGQIIDIFDSASSIIIRIKRNNKSDLLLPFIDKFVKNVDIENKRMEITPIEGML